MGLLIVPSSLGAKQCPAARCAGFLIGSFPKRLVRLPSRLWRLRDAEVTGRLRITRLISGTIFPSPPHVPRTPHLTSSSNEPSLTSDSGCTSLHLLHYTASIFRTFNKRPSWVGSGPRRPPHQRLPKPLTTLQLSNHSLQPAKGSHQQMRRSPSFSTKSKRQPTLLPLTPLPLRLQQIQTPPNHRGYPVGFQRQRLRPLPHRPKTSALKPLSPCPRLFFQQPCRVRMLLTMPGIATPPAPRSTLFTGTVV